MLDAWCMIHEETLAHAYEFFFFHVFQHFWFFPDVFYLPNVFLFRVSRNPVFDFSAIFDCSYELHRCALSFREFPDDRNSEVVGGLGFRKSKGSTPLHVLHLWHTLHSSNPHSVFCTQLYTGSKDGKVKSFCCVTGQVRGRVPRWPWTLTFILAMETLWLQIANAVVQILCSDT